MAPQDPRTPAVQPAADAPGDLTADTRGGVVERYRERRAARKRARLVSARNRRATARWLRRTAGHTDQQHPLARRRETLLHYRVAAVRSDLLEIAALLERAQHPDPASMAALHELLANGCDSPLYNADIHVSELRATLHHIRAALTTRAPAPPTLPSSYVCRSQDEALAQSSDSHATTSRRGPPTTAGVDVVGRHPESQ
jgi:hypothetical protein